MAFFLLEARDLAVAQIPRCGINTMREWLGPKELKVVKNSDPRLMKMSRRVAFIRDPRDRLESAFSLFYWMHDYGMDRHPLGFPVDSWDAFVDYVLDPKIPDNEHWLPQTIHIGSVPNIYHKFENLITKFELYRPGILPHNHKTSRRPSTNYRADELLVKYADDIALYKGAN